MYNDVKETGTLAIFLKKNNGRNIHVSVFVRSWISEQSAWISRNRPRTYRYNIACQRIAFDLISLSTNESVGALIISGNFYESTTSILRVR